MVSCSIPIAETLRRARLPPVQPHYVVRIDTTRCLGRRDCTCDFNRMLHDHLEDLADQKVYTPQTKRDLQPQIPYALQQCTRIGNRRRR